MLQLRRTFLAALAILLFTVPLLAATASELVPQTAAPGARFIVTGSGLDEGALTITFASASGGATAQIVSRTSAVVEGIVPTNAASGTVQVTDDGTVLGSFAFTAAAAPDYQRVVTLAASDASHGLLKSPSGVAVIAATGAAVVADTAHHRIVIVPLSGNLSVLAGNGHPGLVDGTGAAAQFKEPQGIVVDDTHQLIYVADTGNHVIRRVTFDGAVMTLAGSGRPDDADGTGAQAGFKAPTGLALDGAGDVFVADTGNSKIKFISPSGVVHTIAGGGHEGFANGAALQALFKQPERVAVAPDGTVYVSDTKNNVIRAIANGFVTTVAGTGHGGFVNGAAASAEFKQPSGIALDDFGRLLVADAGNDAIRSVSLGDGTVSTMSGGSHSGFLDGSASSALWKGPLGIAVSGGSIFVADSQNDALRAIYSAQSVTAIWPRRGPSAGGNTIRVFGSGFMPGATTVMIGGTTATNIAVLSSTELTVTVPAGSGDAQSVSVTTPAGTTTLPNAYSYVPPPTLSSITPAKGPLAGGTVVTILGANFLDGGDTRITFGGVDAASITFVSPNKLLATTPPGLPTAVDVTVTTLGGTATLPAAFTYFGLPTITNFSPSSGRAGTVVTIAGTNFDPVAADDLVKIASAVAAVSSASPTQLVITVPNGASGGPITVTTVGGTAVSAANFQVVTYVNLVISPDPASVNVGATQQLAARGVAPDGTTSDVTTQVTWTSTNPNIASVSSAGVLSGIAAGTTTVTTNLGTLTKSVNVRVQNPEPLPPDPKTVATPLNQHSIAPFGDGVKFLFTGTNPIQTGVTAGAISDERIAVLRGRTITRDGAVLTGVTIRILNHPEFGKTLSRTDGVFDLVVNGGGRLTVVYEKKGYLSSQRSIEVPWQDFKWAPDVALIPLDANVTAIDLTSPRLQVARGGVVTDPDGSRQTTLLFPAGMTAMFKMPDGSTQPATTLSVRATEYTVGQRAANAMPAGLPPGVAYTWCVELSVDEADVAGATSVLFSKPVAAYLENFVQFPVGTKIPLGSYDRQHGNWVPEKDGRVIRVVSITSGVADLDTNGDGAADDAATLAQLGIDTNERQQLASLYAVGQTLWRMPIQHFSSWDGNWPTFLAPGAKNPDVNADGDQNLNNCCTAKGSIIEIENQTLGEAVPITGSPFSLVYNSSRVTGRSAARAFDVHVGSLPSMALSSQVLIEVAGTRQTLDGEASGAYTRHFDWDGRDAYGRLVTGGVTAHIGATANYYLYYGVSADSFGPTFGKLSSLLAMTGGFD